MAVTVKSAVEIAAMRRSNELLEQVHDRLREMIRPGISTLDIDREGEKLIREAGGIPNFLHYNGYPASICVSVNDEVVHGIPREDRILKEGDIVSLDAGLIWRGLHSDAARTWGVGKISKEDEDLIKAAEECFFCGIEKAKAGNYLNDICKAVEACAVKGGYGVIRDLCGHGIGRRLHEDPQIPNYDQKKKGVLLVPGMTLAIEPMITRGTWKVKWLKDGWTVVTADGSNAAHYENTILITEGEPEILSLTKGRRQN